MNDLSDDCIETLATVKTELEDVERRLGEELGITNHIRFELLRRESQNPALPHGPLVDRWQELFSTYIFLLAEDGAEKTPGQAGYDAYGADSGFKTYDGKEMPRWTAAEAEAAGTKELTEVIKARWEVTTRALLRHPRSVRLPKG